MLDSVTIIIPTFGRSKDLPRLFNSISSQSVMPNEVLVIIGPEDYEALAIANGWRKQNSLFKIFQSIKPSVIFSLNIGLTNASGEIICLIDDDVLLPSDWLLKIKTAFSFSVQLGAYGGQDRIQLENHKNLTNPELSSEIGKFRWDGKIKGNHHCGSTISPVFVDTLKGVNLSFRRNAFKIMKIDERLQHKGAENCWEIDICEQIKLAGYQIVYDNNNYVLHFVSPRPKYDDRVDLYSYAWKKRVFNQAFVLGKYRPFSELLMFSIRSFILGSRYTPGLIWAFLLVRRLKLSIFVLPFRYLICILNGLKSGIVLRNKGQIVN